MTYGRKDVNTFVILGFRIKPGQTAPVCTQYPKAPIKSINSQVIQQLSSPANYIVQITLSCQPPTHMCECVRTHTAIIYGRCYLSLPPVLGECQPQSTCGQRLITPIQMQNYDCFSTACKPRGG